MAAVLCPAEPETRKRRTPFGIRLSHRHCHRDYQRGWGGTGRLEPAL